MNNALKTGLYFFLLLSTSLSLHAEEQSTPSSSNAKQTESVKKQYYIVEVVLFKHLNQQGKLDERWSRPDIFNDNSNSMSTDKNKFNSDNPNSDIPALAEYDLQKKRFQPLRNGIAETSAENYKLTDSAAHIRYSPNFKLLAHFGWTQRSLSKKRALPIRITSNQFSDSLIPSGDLKLYVSRYLHLQVNLEASQCDYTKEKNNETNDKALDQQLENGTSKSEVQNGLKNEAENSTQCVNNIYQFKQNRKMRSRELHYIDNPVFGLLVYVTPFSIDKETVAESE